jgi:hypothetical protein
MKKGKTSHIHGFNTAKVVYGTVDSVNFKSLYLNIQTWVEPTTECENWTRTVLNMSRAIKHSVYESLDKELFDDKFIVDLDLRSSGLNQGKKSFMNLEINFFLNHEGHDFKSKEIKDSLKDITTRIFYENFIGNDYFNFYLTKKIKTNDEMLQLENV